MYKSSEPVGWIEKPYYFMDLHGVFTVYLPISTGARCFPSTVSFHFIFLQIAFDPAWCLHTLPHLLAKVHVGAEARIYSLFC